jgi:uncharacterized membrane protein
MHQLRRLKPFAIRLAWLAAAAGSVAIALGSAVYFEDELPPFMLEKLPLPHEALWLFAVQVHVVATAFALPACLLLAWGQVLKRAPRLHRWLGRVTAAVLLLAAVPSGLYLSLFAKGGLPSTVGFALSGLIVAAAMVEAVRKARARRLVDHRRASMHVLAQLSVAVTSRVMLFGFDALAFDPDRCYAVALWVPVVLGVLAVEVLLPRRSARAAPRGEALSSLALPSPSSRLDVSVARASPESSARLDVSSAQASPGSSSRLDGSSARPPPRPFSRLHVSSPLPEES